MPLLRCTEDECGHTWYERSQLAAGADCERCGSPTRVVGIDDDPPAEASSLAATSPAERPHPAHARIKARQVVQQFGFVRPPVEVRAIARDLGLSVRTSQALGKLRARLVGDAIEVNANEPPVAQRFSVAHELGHYFLRTVHGEGQTAEREADAFANELLVPGPMLRQAMETSTDAADLRKLFKVSRDVLRIAAETHKVSDRITSE